MVFVVYNICIYIKYSLSLKHFRSMYSNEVFTFYVGTNTQNLHIYDVKNKNFYF